jgi:hypothetical protein
MLDLKSLVLNPFFALGFGFRGDKTFVKVGKSIDSFLLFTKNLGIDFDIVEKAAEAAAKYSGPTLSATPNATLPPLQNAAGDIQPYSPPLIVGWVVSIIILPLLLLIFFSGLWVYRNMMGKPITLYEEKIILFGRLINIEKTLDQTVMLIESVAIIGWVIYVVGGTAIVQNGDTILDPKALAFICLYLRLQDFHLVFRDILRPASRAKHRCWYMRCFCSCRCSGLVTSCKRDTVQVWLIKAFG